MAKEDVKNIRLVASVEAIDTLAGQLRNEITDEDALYDLVEAVIAEGLHIQQILGRLEQEVDGERKDTVGL